MLCLEEKTLTLCPNKGNLQKAHFDIISCIAPANLATLIVMPRGVAARGIR